jgi:hypothetical protein
VSPPTNKPSLREARFEDCDGVLALMRRNGLPVESTTARWHWLWQNNPAIALLQEPWPMGWILENESGIAGYLGNVPMLYRFNGKTLRVGAARGFAVDHSARSHSLRLVAAYFSQTGADLLLNTSANAAAASVWGLCKARTVPQANYDKVLLWILKDRAFVESYLLKLGKAPWLAKLAAFLAAPAVSAEGIVRRRIPRSSSSGAVVSVLDPSEIGEEFDVLWQDIVKSRPDRLLADRSAHSLRWHFDTQNAVERQAKVIALRRNGVLSGYAILTREDSGRLGLKRARISDMIAKDDDVSAIDDLLAASYKQAKATGCHALELVGFPGFVRQRALAANPHIYRLPAPPYWYKARDPLIASELEKELHWYALPYDGDATL